MRIVTVLVALLAGALPAPGRAERGTTTHSGAASASGRSAPAPAPARPAAAPASTPPTRPAPAPSTPATRPAPAPASAPASAVTRSAPAAATAGTGETRPAPAPTPGNRAEVPADAPSPRPGVRPAPTPARGAPPNYRPAPPPGQPGYPPGAVAVVPVVPYWWGWGWGWGYYPFYPGPEHLPSGAEAPQAEPNRISATVNGTASLGEASVAGMALAIDGEHAGFHTSIDVLGADVAGGGNPVADRVGWGTLHGSWSLVSERAIRVRLELGGSMLSMSSGSPAGQPYAGNTVFGPSFGVSGTIGLVGPIGIEGHARITPSPVVVTDSRIALALHGGPFAFTVGYRAVAVSGNGTDAPELDLSGTELGLAFRF